MNRFKNRRNHDSDREKNTQFWQFSTREFTTVRYWDTQSPSWMSIYASVITRWKQCWRLCQI